MKQFSLNIQGRLYEVDHPLVMGILNVTPDSFFPGSRTPMCDTDAIKRRVEEMIEHGVDVIDVGGYSSRPGASDIPIDDELRRVSVGMQVIRAVSPSIPVSVDTFRSEVAKEAIVNLGADIVNDISGGMLDDQMFSTVSDIKAPYILMHFRGTPTNMNSLTDYNSGVAKGVVVELSSKIRDLALMGVRDVIVDPGFGFAKSLEQNYELMAALPELINILDRPLLVGISRKSMIYKALGTSPEKALPGTIALNTIALNSGASILRVHDVAEAAQAVKIWQFYEKARRKL